MVLAIDDKVTGSGPTRGDRTKDVVSRVEDYMLTHLYDHVSRTELAQLAGVSIRTLSRAFAQRHGTGPMAFLKRRRLEAARKELLLAKPGEKRITDIALRYDFTQPSKFSSDYKAKFNEAPSDTLYRL